MKTHYFLAYNEETDEIKFVGYNPEKESYSEPVVNMRLHYDFCVNELGLACDPNADVDDDEMSEWVVIHVFGDGARAFFDSVDEYSKMVGGSGIMPMFGNHPLVVIINEAVNAALGAVADEEETE